MRRVVIVVFDGVQTLDVTGPAEVFSIASRLRPGAYYVELAGPHAGTVRSWAGLGLVADRALDELEGPIDTLIVAGGTGVVEAQEDERFVEAVRRAAARSRRVASVCSGAFLLARAGLLDGRRATTHWASCAQLALSYPEIEVDSDPIFIRDGEVATSAGVTAGIDLSLSFVEEDLGPRVSVETARWLVVFAKRPGGQSQFSASLAAQTAERLPLRELQAWLPEHLDEDLGVERMAARAHMSPRTFARAFRREVGVTPAAYVESLRVDRARLALETTRTPIEAVAAQCGFGTVDTMRRAFHRRLGVSPGDYRRRFAA